MSDILKDIQSELPRGVVSSASFEGANIVIYTEDKGFFVEGEGKIREVVNKIKKRIELRADESLLIEEEKAKEKIYDIIPEGAEVMAIHFEIGRAHV